MALSPEKERLLVTDGHILALGGPGSGKTYIALRKAEHEVDASKLKPGQHILFLGFARAKVRLRAVKEYAPPLDADGFSCGCGQLHLRLRIWPSELGEIRNILGDGWNFTGPRNRVSNWQGG